MSVFFSAYVQSDLFGKLVILGLIALSMLSWAVLLYKWWQARQVLRLAPLFEKALEKRKGDLLRLELSDLPQPARKKVPHPFGAVFAALREKTMEILNKNLHFTPKDAAGVKQVYLSATDLELIESYGLTAVSQETKWLEKNLFILSTSATLGPFLGLLGTVWGILVSFSALHERASGASNSAALGGLSTALSTTVLGLLIAIPAIISYNYLKAISRRLSTDMENFLYRLLSAIELQYRKADVE